MDKRGGWRDYHDLSSETFCCTVPKKLVAESFSVSLFPGIENIYALERFLMIFLSKLFCLTIPKTHRMGTLPCFRIFLVSKTSMDKNVGAGGVSCFSVRFF